MPNFRVLPASIIRRMLEGTKDELTELAATRMDAIKRTACPRCGSSLHPELAPIEALFTADDPLPKMLGKCPTCGFLVSPETRVVYSTGDARKVDDPLPLVGRGED